MIDGITDTKKLLLLVTVFLVIFLAFFFIFWRPRYISLSKSQRMLSDKEAELIQLELDARDWPDSITREKLRQYEIELEKLWDLIPTREEVAVLLDEVETHARTANLEISLRLCGQLNFNRKGVFESLGRGLFLR